MREKGGTLPNTEEPTEEEIRELAREAKKSIYSKIMEEPG